MMFRDNQYNRCPCGMPEDGAEQGCNCCPLPCQGPTGPAARWAQWGLKAVRALRVRPDRRVREA